MKQLMVERIMDFAEHEDELGFGNIEQRIATISVDDPDRWSPEKLIEKAYNEANMRRRQGQHRITALGDSMEVNNE